MNKKRYISPETVIIDILEEELIADSGNNNVSTMSLGEECDTEDGRYVHEERGSSIWD